MDKEQQSTITGWIFILSQYNWPRFSQKMRTATERIQKDKTFKYNGLLNFIGESSALEELAWLHNQVFNNFNFFNLKFNFVYIKLNFLNLSFYAKVYEILGYSSEFDRRATYKTSISGTSYQNGSK